MGEIANTRRVSTLKSGSATAPAEGHEKLRSLNAQSQKAGGRNEMNNRCNRNKRCAGVASQRMPLLCCSLKMSRSRVLALWYVVDQIIHWASRTSYATAHTQAIEQVRGRSERCCLSSTYRTIATTVDWGRHFGTQIVKISANMHPTNLVKNLLNQVGCDRVLRAKITPVATRIWYSTSPETTIFDV